MGDNTAVPSVMNPYRDTALSYREAFWKGVLPLPYKEKHPPPTDWTGHRAGYPGLGKIQEWSDDKKQHNIGIRLAGVDADHEIIGIDVDHYLKGDKNKLGWDQLQDLESRLGPLPDTWISSARTDGKSGIRYYRVPRGLAFRGQVAKDIECISKGYRFAVVWPSIHPDGGTYWWFPPAVSPDQDGRQAWDGVLPGASGLPLLPDQWINYLTQGKMVSADAELIDMDSSVDDIYTWADDTFYGDSDTETCDKMREKLEKHKKLVADAATSHDKLINAHYNIIRLAAEGHCGWNAAVNELEKHFVKTMQDREKRGLQEVTEEVFRSRINALRKVKAQVDARLAMGAAAVDPCCATTGACGVKGGAPDQGPPDDPLHDVPRGTIRPVDSYEMNDEGNAQHFVDWFSSAEIGPSVRYAEGRGWLIWHDGDNPHWELDQNGDQTMRRMWQIIKNRQIQYIETALQPDYEQQLQQWISQGGPQPAALKAARGKLEKWKKFAEINGNNRNAENAIKAVRSVPGVSISVNALDQNSFLLGVTNGVVELDRENVRLRRAVATDYVTLNTNMPWERSSELATNIWQKFLDTFLPDQDLQKAVQVALGHCLIGGNPEKKMIVFKGEPNTGKSTMVSALEVALGEYAQTVNQSIFQNHKLNPVLANSISKRIIVCSEFDEQDRLSASVVKRITGSDKIQAELKGSNATREGDPQFVPILATNEVPTIAGADKALQNRLFVIPFDITPDRIDPTYSNQIRAICGPAILGWLIDGYVEYCRIGALPIHDRVKQGTEEFVSELDEIATFAADCVDRQTSPSGYVSRDAMFRAFEQWCDENKLQHRDRPTKSKFTRRMRALGYHSPNSMLRVNGTLGRYFVEVKLVQPKSNVYSIASMTMTAARSEGDGQEDQK